jgi:hypothetical protein
MWKNIITQGILQIIILGTILFRGNLFILFLLFRSINIWL